MLTHGLACKLIAKKGHKAEIEIDGQHVLVPIDQIPAGISDNDIFQLYFSSAKDAKIKEDGLARQILEEILNGK